MNIETLEQKEKLYADYRNKIEELNNIRQRANEYNTLLQESHVQMNKLENEIQSMRKLIDYMIRNDLDPVTAKLKYPDSQIEKESRTVAHHPVYYPGMNQSNGIIAQTIDEIFAGLTEYKG